MIRLYRLKLSDFTSDNRVAYIKITHIDGVKAAYKGNKAQISHDNPLEVQSIHLNDLVLFFEGYKASMGIIKFTLSYDGVNYTPELDTLILHTSEDIIDDCTSFSDIVSKFLRLTTLPEGNLREWLIKENYIGSNSQYYLIPIATHNDLPENLKPLIADLYFSYIGRGFLLRKGEGNIWSKVTPYDNINGNEPFQVVLIIPKDSYREDAVVTINNMTEYTHIELAHFNKEIL